LLKAVTVQAGASAEITVVPFIQTAIARLSLKKIEECPIKSSFCSITIHLQLSLPEKAGLEQ
jgi:hypothetical protein